MLQGNIPEANQLNMFHLKDVALGRRSWQQSRELGPEFYFLEHLVHLVIFSQLFLHNNNNNNNNNNSSNNNNNNKCFIPVLLLNHLMILIKVVRPVE